jgi:hypothetical protein
MNPKTVHALVHPIFTIYNPPYISEFGKGFGKRKERASLIEGIRLDLETGKTGYEGYISSIPKNDVLVLFKGTSPVSISLWKNFGFSEQEAQQVATQFNPTTYQDALIRYARGIVPRFILVEEDVLNDGIKIVKNLPEKLGKLEVTRKDIVKVLGEYEYCCVSFVRNHFFAMNFNTVQVVSEFCVYSTLMGL